MLLVRLEPATRTIVYSSAGHLPAYVLSSKGETKRVLPSTGTPLAIVHSSPYPAIRVPALEPGDVLLMITDGMVEATGRKGVLFGTERLLHVIGAHLEKPAEAITAALHSAIAEYSGVPQPADDMTVVVVKAVSCG